MIKNVYINFDPTFQKWTFIFVHFSKMRSNVYLVFFRKMGFA